MGVRDHLDEAISQGATAIQFVIYDLPGRDCAALASQGELAADEIDRYQSEYIDPIAEIQTDPAYADLRIINIIEIDSLPNLITNVGSRETATANCDTMKANGNYQKGIAYALNQLNADNIYNYIDAGHHGWLGWPDNFKSAATLIAEVAQDGGNNVHGLIVNTANYSATKEPFIKATQETKLTKWIDWNDYVDEETFGLAFVKAAVAAGMPSNSALLIDTSRNGWGGPDRPTAAASGTDDAAIDASRIDRRIHLGNWCNQKGAGLGERPKAAPASGIDAYVWIKPPGESDGSDSQTTGNKGIDQMCDPAYAGNPRNNNNKTSALGNSPVSGAWFSEHFQTLLENAYPAL
jgi:cellulose 1,4-beta-cellobiosidase